MGCSFFCSKNIANKGTLFLIRIDYESLLNAVEELLPRDHIKRLLSQLTELFNPTEPPETEAANDPPSQKYSYEEMIQVKEPPKEESIPVFETQSDPVVPGTGLFIDTRQRVMTPPKDDGDVEGIDMKSSVDEIFTPFTPNDSPDRNLLNRSLGLKKQKQGTDLGSLLQYIVSSLGRHSDSDILVPEDPVPAFQIIIDKTDNCEYTALGDFQSDMELMFQKLGINCGSVDKIRKHYEYLVGYFFPTQMNGGRKRKNCS